ncbi:hypothetical protein TNCV_3380141 [Trichonephila clavipes]|nr:hypothetical protein TNCV_3380141 [Trichonephila clavipes]
MATGSYLTPTYSRSQSEVLGDLHRLLDLMVFDRLCETLDFKTKEHIGVRTDPYIQSLHTFQLPLSPYSLARNVLGRL